MQGGARPGADRASWRLMAVVPAGGGPLCSIVVPAYGEQDRLPALLNGLATQLDLERYEIVVVDDGSADRTAQVAEAALSGMAHHKLVRHAENRGKGAAVRSGVAASTGRYVAFIDADNATDLSALGPMIERCRPGVGAVIGSRHVPGAEVIGAPSARGVMGRIFNHVVRLAAGSEARDTQCGAKVFYASLARVVFSETTVDGFAFDVEVLRRVSALGLAVVEYPVHWHHVAGTKVRISTPLRMLVDIVRLRRRPALPDLAVLEIEGAAIEAAREVLAGAGLGIEALDRADGRIGGGGERRVALIMPDDVAVDAVTDRLVAAGVVDESDHGRTTLNEIGRSPS